MDQVLVWVDQIVLSVLTFRLRWIKFWSGGLNTYPAICSSGADGPNFGQSGPTPKPSFFFSSSISQPQWSFMAPSKVFFQCRGIPPPISPFRAMGRTVPNPNHEKKNAPSPSRLWFNLLVIISEPLSSVCTFSNKSCFSSRISLSQWQHAWMCFEESGDLGTFSSV